MRDVPFRACSVCACQPAPVSQHPAEVPPILRRPAAFTAILGPGPGPACYVCEAHARDEAALFEHFETSKARGAVVRVVSLQVWFAEIDERRAVSEAVHRLSAPE